MAHSRDSTDAKSIVLPTLAQVLVQILVVKHFFDVPSCGLVDAAVFFLDYTRHKALGLALLRDDNTRNAAFIRCLPCLPALIIGIMRPEVLVFLVDE